MPLARAPGHLELALRTRARPAFGAGLRAALATVTPLLVAPALHWRTGSWLMLAAFSVALGDKGGNYLVRARALATLTVVFAISAAVGALVGPHDWLTILVVLVWAAAAGLARGFGPLGTSLGISSTVLLLFSINVPPESGGDALYRALAVLGGGAWAAFLSLALWPVHPYRPVRGAVARVYRDLADYARMLAGDAAPLLGASELPEARARLRQELETAREQIAQVRGGLSGETQRGEALLVLLEAADQLFGSLIALTDLLEARRDGARAALRAQLEPELRRVAEGLERMATTVTVEARLRLGLAAPAASILSEDATGDATGDTAVDDPTAQALLTRLAQDLTAAAATADALQRDERPPVAPLTALDQRTRSPGEILRQLVSPGSSALHHAIRVGVVIAVATLLVRLLKLPHGYWVTFTALVILQPAGGATTVKALQRVAGTVIGGAIAAGLSAALHDPRAIMVLVFVLTIICVALLPVNYTLYSIILTPTFVLLAEVSAQEWNLAWVRILNTVIGGALALAGTALLWPSHEGGRVLEATAAALRAAREHLLMVAQLWTESGPAAEEQIAAARRRLGLAVLAAEAALEQRLGEWRRRDEHTEAAMTAVIYLRRLAAAVTGLAATRYTERSDDEAPVVARATASAATMLEELAASLDEHRPAPPEPPPPLAEPRDPVTSQLFRVGRQLRVLRDAVARM